MNPRPKVLWMQLGVRNDEAAKLAEAKGIKVVMNRCPKIEYGRLSSEIAWMGVNTRTLSAKKSADAGARHPAAVAQPCDARRRHDRRRDAARQSCSSRSAAAERCSPRCYDGHARPCGSRRRISRWRRRYGARRVRAAHAHTSSAFLAFGRSAGAPAAAASGSAPAAHGRPASSRHCRPSDTASSRARNWSVRASGDRARYATRSGAVRQFRCLA